MVLKTVPMSTLGRPASTVHHQPDEEAALVGGLDFPNLPRTQLLREAKEKSLVS
jgi:hypothetical protein